MYNTGARVIHFPRELKFSNEDCDRFGFICTDFTPLQDKVLLESIGIFTSSERMVRWPSVYIIRRKIV